MNGLYIIENYNLFNILIYFFKINMKPPFFLSFLFFNNIFIIIIIYFFKFKYCFVFF